jgi:hypothetical protein
MNNSKIWFLLIWEEANKKFVQEALMLIVAPLGPNVNGLEEDLENYLGNQSLSELLVLELPPFIWV